MDDFQLEDDYANCVEDYDTLSIYDADFADPDRLLGTYCGTAIPTYFTSTGNNMFVVFKSDVSNSRRGFQATFEFRDGKRKCEIDITLFYYSPLTRDLLSGFSVN